MARKNKNKNAVQPQRQQRPLSKAQMRDARRQGRALDGYYEEEYEYEEETGITKKSMKRGLRYVIIAIIFLLLSIGAFFGADIVHAQMVTNSKTNCWLYEQAMEQNAYKYMNDNHFASLPAYIEDIPGYQPYQCPAGGQYTWNPVTGEYSCSFHGEHPSDFNQAQSVSQGQETKITNAN